MIYFKNQNNLKFTDLKNELQRDSVKFMEELKSLPAEEHHQKVFVMKARSIRKVDKAT